MDITVKTFVPHSHESTLVAKLSYAKLRMAGLSFLFPVNTCETKPLTVNGHISIPLVYNPNSYATGFICIVYKSWNIQTHTQTNVHMMLIHPFMLSCHLKSPFFMFSKVSASCSGHSCRLLLWWCVTVLWKSSEGLTCSVTPACS